MISPTTFSGRARTSSYVARRLAGSPMGGASLDPATEALAGDLRIRPPRRHPLRENLPFLVYRFDPLQRDAVRSHPHVALLDARVLAHLAVGALHCDLEASVHLFLRPHLGALVLHPLVVADRDAARVGENVGQNVHALLEEDALADLRARTVRALGDELHVEGPGLRLAHLVLEGARREDIRLGREELLARDRLAPRVAGDGSVDLDVVLQLVRVEPLGVVD